MITTDKTIGLILSGGAGQRMSGQDKGLVEFRDQPLVVHVINALRPQVNDLVLCVHRNQARYACLNNKVAMDASIEFEGPMAGIVAAIKDPALVETIANSTYLAVSPCDVPFLGNDHVARLKSAIEKRDCDVAVAHDGTRRQNLHCLIHAPRCTKSLTQFYLDGGRAMHRWFKTVNSVDVDFSDQKKSFYNINSESDLERAGI